MSEPRIWSLARLPAGLAAGHLLASAALDGLGLSPTTGLGHGVLQGLGCLAVPLLLVALARSVLGGARSELPPVSLSSLAIVQVGLFLVIELVEHAAVGLPPDVAVREPSLALGLLTQLAVAWTLWAALRVAARAASRWVGRQPGGSVGDARRTQRRRHGTKLPCRFPQPTRATALHCVLRSAAPAAT